MTTPADRTADLQAAIQAAAAMNTAALNLGRLTPKTRRQRESALAGIAQCDADWAAGELTTSDDMIRQGRDPYWKGRLRHPLARAAPRCRRSRPNQRQRG